MTDFPFVRALADKLSLSEASVDTPAIIDELAALKRATLEVGSSDPAVAQWLSGSVAQWLSGSVAQRLSDEHFAGGVLATAATMNKRAELSGKGAPFDRVSRSDIIDRYNRWAKQLVDRIDAVHSGNATSAQYLPGLAKFKADPITKTP